MPHEGQDLVNQDRVEEAITSFYEDVFESPEDRSHSLNFEFLRIPRHDLHALEEPFF